MPRNRRCRSVTEARTLSKRRGGCHEQCPACSDPTPDPRCDERPARRRCGQRAGLPRNRLGSLPVGQRKAASDPRGVAPARAGDRGPTVRLRQLVSVKIAGGYYEAGFLLDLECPQRMKNAIDMGDRQPPAVYLATVVIARPVQSV